MAVSLAAALAILNGTDSRIGVGNEAVIILRVADSYQLDDDQTRLLLAIRRVENGGPGNEFGVGSDDKLHRAHRYRKDPRRSVELQAEWAAGTVRERYTGNLDSFSRRYCPPNAVNWAKMVQYRISKGGGL